jgi:5-methylcytosine-specific restriction enzyme A
MFIQGQIYHRRSEIHAVYQGQQQGGISTPANHKVILIFTGETGKQHGYLDGWSPEGIFLYTGEGQIGDMTFTGGNRAIRDHLNNNRDLHVFEYAGKGYVRYIGQFDYIGHQWRQSPDREGKLRRAIVFELLPVNEPESIPDPINDSKDEVQEINQPLNVLRQRALDRSTTNATPIERKAIYRKRSAAIKAYAIKRSNGICGGCDQPAPFSKPNGLPFLEVHHVNRLSDGGIDHPNAVIALCPNCHRRAHYSKDASQFNVQLVVRALEQEKTVLSTQE